jgi:hypothetical protein
MQTKKWYRIQNFIYQTVRGKDRISMMHDVDNTSISDWETLVWNSTTNKWEGKSVGLIGLSKYDSAAFTIGWSTTNYNVDANEAALWNTVTSAKYIRITSSADIGIKINSTGATSYPMTSTQSPYEIYMEWVANLFITTAGSAANVTILLMS